MRPNIDISRRQRDSSASSWEGPSLVESGPIRLSEIITALSTALDLTEGQPPGHAIRAGLIGMRIGREVGLAAAEMSALYYALLLKDLGCSSNAAKMAYLFGTDERVVKCNVKTVDWQRMTARVRFAARSVAPTGGTLQKMLALAAIARAGEAGARGLIETRCERGFEIAREMDFPEATAVAIRSLDEHWNGKGHPAGLKGEEIPLLSRIMGLAQTVEVFGNNGGVVELMDLAKQRRGQWFDPELVDILLALRRDLGFWATVFGPDADAAMLLDEPTELVLYADQSRIDRICAGFSRVVDAKSPWTHQHSEGVARIAVGMGTELGLDEIRLRDLRRAALLHDLGKLGVSNAILDKPGRPTDAEFVELRLHPDYSERIIGKVAAFRPLADVACAHHERLDGQGYHRRLPGDSLHPASRLLSVADVFEALTADRPYRPGMPLEASLDIIHRESGSGLCPDSIDALELWLIREPFRDRTETQHEAVDALCRSV